MIQLCTACTKNYNARAHPLFCSLNLLFSDVPVAVAVVVFLNSLLNGQNFHPTLNFILLSYTTCLIFFPFVCFRVLEASLAENKSGLKRKRGDPWVRFVDPVNPYERQRQDGCPVGLKNVGNTCWFSAVIQVRCLFHVPFS